MGFIKDMFSSPISVVAPVLGGMVGRNKRKEANAQAARDAMYANQASSLMDQGFQMGRERAQQLTGMNATQLGDEISSLYATRKADAEGPSKAADAIRSKSQNIERRIASAGGSEQQQRQQAISGAQAAGVQEEQDYVMRRRAQQEMLGSFMRAHSTLEPGFAQLMQSSQVIMPEKPKSGLAGDLLGFLGL